MSQPGTLDYINIESMPMDVDCESAANAPSTRVTLQNASDCERAQSSTTLYYAFSASENHPHIFATSGYTMKISITVFYTGHIINLNLTIAHSHTSAVTVTEVFVKRAVYVS